MDLWVECWRITVPVRHMRKHERPWTGFGLRTIGPGLDPFEARLGEERVELAPALDRLVDRHLPEAHAVADRSQLAELPEARVGDRRGDDEAARGRAVGPRITGRSPLMLIAPTG